MSSKVTYLLAAAFGFIRASGSELVSVFIILRPKYRYYRKSFITLCFYQSSSSQQALALEVHLICLIYISNQYSCMHGYMSMHLKCRIKIIWDRHYKLSYSVGFIICHILLFTNFKKSTRMLNIFLANRVIVL